MANGPGTLHDKLVSTDDGDLACPICHSSMRHVFDKMILRKYTGHYYFCDSCGFLRIHRPYWLKEAYSSAICAADTGIMVRNLAIVGKLSPVCDRMLKSLGPYLDFGGGHGILVRLMRDRGFDFRWYDEHAENQLARGFEYGSIDRDCVAVTAFEVLEHIEDPLQFVRSALQAARCGTFIFTTELFSGNPPEEWWYYAPTEGQHIGFFRSDTLDWMGKELGLRVLSENGIHMFTDRNIRPADLRAATSRLGQMLGKLQDRSRGSLVMADHNRIVEGLGNAGG
jgi:hypothetical protein